MVRLRKSKKAVVWGPIIQLILGVVVMSLFILAVNKPLYSKVKSFMAGEEFKLPTEEFELFVPQYTTEEQTVVDSMNGLVMAINSIATNKVVDTYSENKVEIKELPFDSYKISYSSHVELEEEGIAGNDYRDWIFEKEFDVKKDKEGKIIRQDDHKIFADYIYGSCNDENENDWFLGKSGWVDCSSGLPKTSKDDGDCYCPDEDDREDGFEEMRDLSVKETLIGSASKIGLAPVRDLSPVYNVVLTTYKDGKEVCKAGTWSQKDKITDTSVNDLRTWAQNEDRNGNGIRGSYDQSLYKDANWWETLPQGITKNDVSPALVNLYFPNGRVKATGEGEGCLDSPTWLECQGIRVYYCGKFGYKSGSGNQPSEYYYWLDKDGEIHSRAGIKVLRDINPEYKGYLEDESKKGYSSINRKGVNDEIIEIRDSDAKKKQESKVGAIDYAKEYDLDLPAFIIPNPLLTANALGMRKMDDPTTYCYDGKQIGTSATIVKCDPDFGGCGVCNFEMPQNISKDYQSALNYIAGYGDPKYIMYYEAFPLGEEEAWEIDVHAVSFSSIVAWNLAAQALPLAGASLKNIAKYLGKVTVVPNLVVRVARGVLKPIAWAGKKSSDVVAKLGERVSLSIKSVFLKGTKKIMSKEAAERLLIKVFTDSDSILRYAKPDDIKQLTSLEEVAEWVVKNNDDELKALEQLLKEEKVVSKYNIFKGKLPTTIARKGVKYATGYAFALSMAREDSMNQKFIPIGYNEIGAKEPYKGAITTGAGLDELNDKVSQYYLQLTKDRYEGGIGTQVLLNQNAQRFFLASPCKADIAVVQSECQCWSSKEEAEEPTGEAAIILGKTPVLKSTINPDYNTDNIKRYENAVKVCRDRSAGFSSITLEDPISKTDCIVINPVVKEGTFCYSGSHTIAEMGKYSVVAGTIAANVALDIATTPLMITPLAPLAKVLNFGLYVGLDSIGALFINKIAKAEKWPNH